MVARPCYFYRYFVPTGHYVTIQVNRLKTKSSMITHYFRQAKAFSLQPSVQGGLCPQPNTGLKKPVHYTLVNLQKLKFIIVFAWQGYYRVSIFAMRKSIAEFRYKV